MSELKISDTEYQGQETVVVKYDMVDLIRRRNQLVIDMQTLQYAFEDIEAKIKKGQELGIDLSSFVDVALIDTVQVTIKADINKDGVEETFSVLKPSTWFNFLK